jgi:hypothetical protein
MIGELDFPDAEADRGQGNAALVPHFGRRSRQGGSRVIALPAWGDARGKVRNSRSTPEGIER